MSPLPLRARHQQAGAATLVTVMVLFFIMALVAAYANRNLIVEQRVAMTYQSLGIATEGASQAVSRVLSLLNSGNIDDSCKPSGAAGSPLRDRLTQIDAAGMITPHPDSLLSPGGGPPFTVVCDRSRPSGEWSCQCPAAFNPSMADPGPGPSESMLARLQTPASAGPGRIAVLVQTCAEASSKCVDPDMTDNALVGRTQHLQLLGAVKMPPVSALVATGKVDLGAGLRLQNNEAVAGGIALQSGSTVDGVRDQVQGPAGSPSATAIVANDPVLAPLSKAVFFRRFFGMGMDEYANQPAIRRLSCETACAKNLKALVDSGIRMVWHAGDLSLSDEVEIGTAAKPVLLVVDGNLTINGPLRLHGLVFSGGNLVWSNVSVNPSLVQGAVLVAGNVQGDAGATALYDHATLNALRLQTGSFIRLPGGSRRER